MIINQEDRFGFDCLLFEKCNMNCDFCLESHSNSKIDFQWINDIPQLLLNRFKNEYKSNIKLITFRFWGGELFFDEMPDEMFLEYEKMVLNIQTLFKNQFPNIDLSYSWVSNGVYTKIDRVINLLQKTDSKIAISYDPVGRYKTKNQENLAIQNAKILNDKNLLMEFSITLTKLNINAYIRNETRFNDLQFCKKFDINYYIPNVNWQILLPSDDDLFNFFKWAVDNEYFSIIDISRLLKTLIYPDAIVDKICNCDKHISACKNCLTYNCVKSSTIFPNSDFYGDKNITEENVSTIKQRLGLMKRGCMFCSYSNKCPKGCHTSILFKEYKITECPYKRLYNYIENNSKILDNFKKWEEINNNIPIKS